MIVMNKRPKHTCKCGKENWFRLYGTENIVQCKKCGVWWISNHAYVKELPIDGLGQTKIAP